MIPEGLKMAHFGARVDNFNPCCIRRSIFSLIKNLNVPSKIYLQIRVIIYLCFRSESDEKLRTEHTWIGSYPVALSAKLKSQHYFSLWGLTISKNEFDHENCSHLDHVTFLLPVLVFAQANLRQSKCLNLQTRRCLPNLNVLIGRA